MDTTSLSLRLSTLTHLVGTSAQGAVLSRLRSIAAGLDDVSDASVRFLVQHWSEYDAHLQPLPPPAPDAHSAVHALELLDELATAHRDITNIAALQGTLDGKANKALAKAVDASRLRTVQQQEQEQDEHASVIHQRVLDLVTNWANYTTSVSHAFVLLDTQLATLERTLTRLEHR